MHGVITKGTTVSVFIVVQNSYLTEFYVGLCLSIRALTQGFLCSEDSQCSPQTGPRAA